MSRRTTAGDAASNKKELVARLTTLLSRVPPSFQVWDYERAHSFKAAAATGAAALRNQRCTEQKLHAAVAGLEHFHEGLR